MKILLVEDEPTLVENIANFLKSESYFTDTAITYDRADELIILYDYDCVLLDINLPDGSGLDLIHKVKKKNKSTGILIISARDSVNDRVKGLDLGADDYLTKPFHITELNARVKALIRRNHFQGNEIGKVKEISIDYSGHKVFVNEEEVKLTPKEYELLVYFITNKNRVLSKSSICEYLIGEQSDWMDSFDLIYTHLKNLRKKLLKAGANDYIKTIYGVGYSFEV